MGKSSKDNRDIYYRQGKSEGYRARSAYKLLHLDEQYGFLGGSNRHALEPRTNEEEEEEDEGNRPTNPTPKRVVDLCAAPGSWSQVLSRQLSSVPGSHLVAVDLQAMAPLEGVTQIIGDITTPATADAVSLALGSGSQDDRARAQLIVCDGAPDVTGLHDLDEYLQSQLLLAACQITFRLLEEGGTFVAKIFTQQPQGGHTVGNVDLKAARPSTSGSLLADQLRNFFERVDIAKPRSSRFASVEHFLVCQGFKPLKGLPKSILGATATDTDPKFQDEQDARLGLVEFAERLKTQMKDLTQNKQTGDELLFKQTQQLHQVIPFVTCGDLSGFDQ